jgi:nucleotide-binding universal stress UspA family protein
VFRSIVVGTDGSETAREAVGAAVELAKLTGAKLERLAGTALTARDLKVVRAIDEKWSST